MKNYFNFTLTGEKLFPIWILFMLLFIAPYGFLIFKMKSIQAGSTPPLYFFPLIILLIIVALVLTFYIIKLSIENVGFKDKTFASNNDRKLQFGYDIDQLSDFLFIWGQILLTIITLGIYFPWAFSKIGGRILGKTYLTEDNAT